MTVAALASSFEYNGNGVTVLFAAPFRYLAATHLEAKVVAASGVVTPLAYGIDFTATPGPTDAGGTVTCVVAPATGARLRIRRVTPRSQATDYTTGDTFPAETHEAALDRAMLVDQEQDVSIGDTASRALRVPEGEVVAPLPAAALRANKFQAYDAAGVPIVSAGTGADAGLRADLANPVLGTTLLAYPGGGTLQTQLNKVILTPEQFGANGSAATDQTAFMEAMMVAARVAGRATVLMADGSTYTSTNPFIWGGLAELTVIGGKLMNFRSGAFPSGGGAGQYDANYQPFRNPLASLPNGIDPYDPQLAAQGAGVPYYGTGCTLTSSLAGTTSLTSLVGTATVGEAIIGGWDRYGVNGFPYAQSYREKIDITVVAGTALTTRFKTKHAYDERAPAKADRAGPVELFMLNRPGSASVRPHTHMKRLTIIGTEFLVNAALTGTGVNGLPSFGGADLVELIQIKAPKANVSSCETAILTDCRIEGDFEIDKMIDTLTIDGGRYGAVVGALGCRKVIIKGGARIDQLIIAPLEGYEIEAGCIINGNPSGGAAALISNYAYGTGKIRIANGVTLTAIQSSHDRIFDAGSFDITPASINPNGFSVTRAVFDASGILKNCRVGSTVYAGRIAVGKVNVMPTCPTGDPFTADVFTGVKWFGPTPAIGVLSILWLEDVVIEGKPTIEGAFARQVHSTLGNDTGSQRLGNVRDWCITESGVEFGQEIIEYDVGTDNNVKFHLGQGYRFSEFNFDVETIAVASVALGMAISADLADGTNIGVVGSIDLKTAGLRRLDRTGFIGGVIGADVLTYAWPTGHITNINIADNSRRYDVPVTISIATPGVVTLVAHGLLNNQTFVFTTTGALPTGFTAGTTYYARNPAANTFEVSLTSGGASIATSGTQSGVHRIGAAARWRISGKASKARRA